VPNGLVVLKGGDLKDEIAPFIKTAEVTPCSQWFQGEWFNTKQIIYLPL
jgi:16S rRNA (guanine527-N7)-methyltransferase